MLASRYITDFADISSDEDSEEERGNEEEIEVRTKLPPGVTGSDKSGADDEFKELSNMLQTSIQQTERKGRDRRSSIKRSLGFYILKILYDNLSYKFLNMFHNTLYKLHKKSCFLMCRQHTAKHDGL